MDVNPARGTDQAGAEAVSRGVSDHLRPERDHPNCVVAAMAVGAAKAPVHAAVGQCAAFHPGLVNAQPVHAVAPVTDDEGAAAVLPAGDIYEVAVEHVMGVGGNDHLTGVVARKPGRGRGKLTARGDTGGERHAKHEIPNHAGRMRARG